MSEELTTITKEAPPYTSMDFAALREEGLQHIRDLAGKIWTDHNLHDPGITALEALSFAITDLGYRTNFDASRLLATEEGQAFAKNFHTLANIAVNRPLTVNDYRKLLHDIPLIKSGWLEKALSSETGKNINGLYNVMLELDEDVEYGNLNDNSIRYTVNLTGGLGVPTQVEIDVEFPPWNRVDPEIDDVDPNTLTSVTVSNFLEVSDDPFLLFADVLLDPASGFPELPVKIRTLSPTDQILDTTLYNTQLQAQLLNEAALFQTFLNKRKTIQTTLDLAKARLMENRNLCEDFLAVEPMSLQEIGLKVDLEVTPGANLEELQAQVYFNIDQFLSPAVKFYSIAELLEKGKNTDEIFRGPLLENGFIDDEELNAKTHRDILYTSDLVQIIMDVQDVIAVKSIRLCNYVYGDVAGEDARNCLNLVNPKRFVPQLAVGRSEVTFYQEGQLPTKADSQISEDRLKELIALARIGLKAGGTNDLDVPLGEYADWGNFYSIMNDLPITYAVGPNGLAPTASEQRVAQSRQLKGFLLFFDQLFANYLSQLAHLRDLFSMEDNSPGGYTYFSQPIYTAPDVQALIKAFVNYAEVTSGVDADDPVDFMAYATNASNADWNGGVHNYLADLENIVESTELFEDRRNRFMDHLIGRFCESFTEYALYQYEKLGTAGPARIIKDKSRFLIDYDVTSQRRGNGFNDHGDLLDPVNVSGLQTRVKRLLGLPEYSEFVTISPNGSAFDFSITDESGTVIFEPISGVTFATMGEAQAAANRVITLGRSATDYATDGSGSNVRYTIQNEAGSNLVQSPQTYTSSTVTEGIDLAALFFNRYHFTIVENTLLRPKQMGDSELAPFLASPIDCLNFEDPYSFRVNVVIPAWLNNTDLDSGNNWIETDEDFRRLFKRTLRLETPAHIYLKLNWINDSELEGFNDAWRAWLQENQYDPGDVGHNAPDLSSDLTTLITQINSNLTNLFDAVYTVAAAKYLSEYQDGDILATVEDPDGDIVFAMALTGSATLPDGVAFDTTNGNIYVKSAAALRAAGVGGSPYALNLATFNAGGECTIHNISIAMNTDSRAQLTPAYTYTSHVGITNGTVLFSITDADGLIDLTLKSGSTFPPGIGFNDPAGAAMTVEVIDETILVQGSWSFTICATDQNGSETILDAVNVILNDGNPASLTWTAPKILGDYATNNVLATIADAVDGGVVSDDVRFRFSDGTELVLDDYGMALQTRGTAPTQYTELYVTNGTDFQTNVAATGSPFIRDAGSGRYYLPVLVDVVDGKGGFRSIDSTMNLLSSTDFNLIVYAPQLYLDYQVGDIMARVEGLNGVGEMAGFTGPGLTASQVTDPNNPPIHQPYFVVRVTDEAAFQNDVETNWVNTDTDNPDILERSYSFTPGDSGGNTSSEQMSLTLEVLFVDQKASYIPGSSDPVAESALADGDVLGHVEGSAAGELTGFAYPAGTNEADFTSLGYRPEFVPAETGTGGSVQLKVNSAATLRNNLTPGDYTVEEGVYKKTFTITAQFGADSENVDMEVSILAELDNALPQVVIETPQAPTTYTQGEILTSVVDVTDGGVANIEVQTALDLDAMGISVSIDNKNIARFSVADTTKFLDGVNGGFYTRSAGYLELSMTASVTDVLGGKDDVDVVVRLAQPNTPPLVALYDPKEKDSYATDEVIASITDVSDNGIATVTIDTENSNKLTAIEVRAQVEPGGIVRFRVIDGADFETAVDGTNYTYDNTTDIYSQTITVTTTDGNGNVSDPIDVLIEVWGGTFETSGGGDTGGGDTGGGDTGGGDSGGGSSTFTSTNSYTKVKAADYLDTLRPFNGIIDFDSNFSVVMLVRRTNISGGWDFIFSNRNNPDDTTGLSIALSGAAKPQVNMHHTSSNYLEVRGDTPLTEGSWHLLTMTYSSGPAVTTTNIRLYLDDELLEFEAARELTETPTWATGISFHLLADRIASNAFDGNLCYLAVYDRALELADIQPLFDSGSFNGDPEEVNGIHAFYLFDNDTYSGGRFTVVDERGGGNGASSANMPESDLTNQTPY